MWKRYVAKQVTAGTMARLETMRTHLTVFVNNALFCCMVMIIPQNFDFTHFI